MTYEQDLELALVEVVTTTRGFLKAEMGKGRSLVDVDTVSDLALDLQQIARKVLRAPESPSEALDEEADRTVEQILGTSHRAAHGV